MNIAFDDHNEILLTQRLIEGDHLAFRKIYEQHAGALMRRILRLTKVEPVAEDLLQETFVKLWEKRQTIDPALPVKPWLFKVAENLVFQFYRELARDTRLQEQVAEWYGNEDSAAFEEALFSLEKQELLQKAIQQLSPKRQQVFNLCKLQGQTYEEAAHTLGISPSTVSNQLIKANASVRLYLSQHKDSLFSLFSIFI